MFVIICKLIFLSIILICSLVGNVIIITVVSLRKALRKTINFDKGSRSASDYPQNFHHVYKLYEQFLKPGNDKHFYS